MKYFVIAGEASGDLHGANLIKALRQEDSAAEVRCWGGDLMAAAGATVLKHYRELAFMGFIEVVKNLLAIARNFRTCKAQILDYQPDVLILIDYPGFNLRMAAWAKKAGVRVFYYISPQLWAWHSSRVRIIRQAVERMYVILPFETDFYKKHAVEVDFCGHPLLDVVENCPHDFGFFTKNNLDPARPIVALLPGSRRQEISRMLETMLEMPSFFPDYQFVVAGAPSIGKEFYQSFLAKNRGAGSQVVLLENQTYALLQHAAAALVTSGTATLETALFKVPQVVCYRGNALSYWLARRLVNKELKFIAMVNLVMDRKVVEELIQDDFNLQNLQVALQRLLAPDHRQAVLSHYAALRLLLGSAGASERVAKRMVERLGKRPGGFR